MLTDMLISDDEAMSIFRQGHLIAWLPASIFGSGLMLVQHQNLEGS